MYDYLKILVTPTLQRLSEDLTRIDYQLKNCPIDDIKSFNALYFERSRIIQTFGEICAYGDMTNNSFNDL